MIMAIVFKSESLSHDEAFFFIGVAVCIISLLTFFIKFPTQNQEKEFVKIKSKEKTIVIKLSKKIELILE